jgi:peptidoglycan/xylan/chitin deacetylase (PgdA/CDA1 family)
VTRHRLIAVFSALTFMAACKGPTPDPAVVKAPFLEDLRGWTAKTAVRDNPFWSNRVGDAMGQYRGRTGVRFAEFHPSTFRRLATNEKVVALTFDACGGRHGSGFNAALIGFLEGQRVPATLFISWRWVTNGNESHFRRILANPLFQVENHGLTHRPCAVNPREIYQTPSTPDLASAVMEIAGNAALLERATGRRTTFYRSGTAYYDDVAMEIAATLGHRVAGWDVLSGDVGASVSADAIAEGVLRRVRSGSVVILHMNQPAWQAAPAVERIVGTLRGRGYRFVTLGGQAAVH